MLILTRNIGETIRIGDDIEISVADVRGGAVRLSIKAPREVRVFREEVYQRVQSANEVAAQVAANVSGALAAAAVAQPAATQTVPVPAASQDAPDDAPTGERDER